MNLGNSIRSVIPSAQGDVLAVLARTEEPLTGRRVAALTDGRVSQKGTNLALRALVDAGLVTVEDHPPAKLYQLNRRHLAASSVEALASLRGQLIDAMRNHVDSWEVPAWGVWLFGSAARGDGDESSDIDVLIVRGNDVDDADPDWLHQVERFIADVTAWAGNRCEVVEYDVADFDALLARDDRLTRDLRADGIALTSRRLPRRAAGAR
jgi:hypothetical protein